MNSILQYVSRCPICDVIPDLQLNDDEDAIRLRCGSCGFSSLYADTADAAARDWEERCDEYKQEAEGKAAGQTAHDVLKETKPNDA